MGSAGNTAISFVRPRAHVELELPESLHVEYFVSIGHSAARQDFLSLFSLLPLYLVSFVKNRKISAVDARSSDTLILRYLLVRGVQYMLARLDPMISNHDQY